MNDTRARNPLNQHSSDDTARTMNPTTYHPPSLSLGTPAGISPLKLNFSYPIPIPTPAMRVPPPPRQQPALPNGMEYARALTGLSTLPIREYWELRREVDLESVRNVSLWKCHDGS
ncbi:hypothetical protein BDN67DRAFT_970092 [Paxillus ammoniavirescens]|nr:hypothetical protein BDN67DRAFT_970092 [Paxillus ammoniavirescens]